MRARSSASRLLHRVHLPPNQSDACDDEALVRGLVARLDAGGERDAVDPATADRIRGMHREIVCERLEEHSPRSPCPTAFVKPLSRAFWMPADWGGGSSLYWKPDERAASISELVTDLVMVYVFSTLCHEAAANMVRQSGGISGGGHRRFLSSPGHHSNGTHPGDDIPAIANPILMDLVMILSIFLPCWMHWFDVVEWENIYGQDDLVHAIKWVVNLILLARLGGAVPECVTSSVCGSFAGWLVACKCVHVVYVQYVRRANHVLFSYENNVTTLRIIIEIALWTVVSLTAHHHGAALGTLDNVPLIWWWIATATPFLFRWIPLVCFGQGCERRTLGALVSRCSTASTRLAPRHLPLLIERVQLIAIIAIGEMSVSVLYQAQKIANFYQDMRITLLLVMFAIVRFDVLDRTEHIHMSRSSRINVKGGDKHHSVGPGFRHALSVSVRRASGWLLCNLAICAGVLFAAAGIMNSDPSLMDENDKLFSVGTFTASLFTTIKQAVHEDGPGLERRRCMRKKVRILLRIVLSFMMLLSNGLSVAHSAGSSNANIHDSGGLLFTAIMLCLYSAILLVHVCGKRIRQQEVGPAGSGGGGGGRERLLVGSRQDITMRESKEMFPQTRVVSTNTCSTYADLIIRDLLDAQNGTANPHTTTVVDEVAEETIRTRRATRSILSQV